MWLVFSLCVKDPCLEAIATLRCCSCSSCVRLEWALEADTQFYRMDVGAPMHGSRCWLEDSDLNLRSLLKLKFMLCWQAQVPRNTIWAMGWPGAWQKAPCTEKMTHSLQRCDPFSLNVQFTFNSNLWSCLHVLPSLQSYKVPGPTCRDWGGQIDICLLHIFFWSGFFALLIHFTARQR